VYIVMFLLIAPIRSSAKLHNNAANLPLVKMRHHISYPLPLTDTIIKKRPADEEDKKIKEVLKAKRQSKPEKIDDANKTANPPRERRPEGMERPPEIPRRNNN
jgi:hypothetical protein